MSTVATRRPRSFLSCICIFSHQTAYSILHYLPLPSSQNSEPAAAPAKRSKKSNWVWGIWLLHDNSNTIAISTSAPAIAKHSSLAVIMAIVSSRGLWCTNLDETHQQGRIGKIPSHG